MPSASKVKLADALASGDTSAIADLASRIASRAAAVQTSTPSGVPYRQAIAQRQ